MKLPSLSIFFPAFNEEKNIKPVLQKTLKIAPKISNKFEIIVVNDGSSDNTADVVKEIIKNNPNVHLVEHKKNLGYGAALRSGFYKSKYEYITYMDSDGQFDFKDIYKLINGLGGSDLAIGFRIKRADPLLRKVNGKLWNLLISILLGLKIIDIDCGFKLMRKKVIENIPKLTSNGATISAELLVKSKREGFKIVQVGLPHHPRLFGSNTHGNLLHMFRAFKDLFVLLKKVYF